MRRSLGILGTILAVAAAATALTPTKSVEAGIYFHANVSLGIGRAHRGYYHPGYYHHAPAYAPSYGHYSYTGHYNPAYIAPVPAYYHSYYPPVGYYGYGYVPHFDRGELEIEYKYRNGFWAVEYDYDD